MARKWVPHQYVDEITPTPRETPDAWLVSLPGDGVMAIAGDETGEGEGEPIILADGQIVEFSWMEDFGTASFTVLADGRWTAEPPMPPNPEGGSTVVMVVGDPETLGFDIDSFARCWCEENNSEPGTVTIRYYAWSDSGVPFVLRHRRFHPVHQP